MGPALSFGLGQVDRSPPIDDYLATLEGGAWMSKRIAIAASCFVIVTAPAAARSDNHAQNSEAVTPSGSVPQSGRKAGEIPLSAFEMFGMSPSGTYTGEISVAGRKCKLKGSGVENCAQIYGPAAISDVRLKILLFMFNNGKLFGVSGTAPFTNFSRVAEAFEAKYGKPYKTENTVWRNRAGASFDNVKKTWVFSDGLLTLEARGSTIDEMKFLFASVENAPQKDPPAVNF